MSDEPQSADDDPGIVGQVVPDAIRRRFALKFALALAVMALAVGAIGIVATDQIAAQTSENVEEEYENVAIGEASIVEQWVDRNTLSTRRAADDRIWTGDTDLQFLVVEERSSLHEDVSNVHLIERNASGTWFLSSTATLDGATATSADRQWLNRMSFSEDTDVVTSPIRETDGGEYRLSFASPVPETENRYLVVEYDLADLTGSLRGAERADGGFTQVVAADNTIITAESSTSDATYGDGIGDRYTNTDSAREPLNAATEDGEAGVIAEMAANDVLDEAYTVGYAPVDGTEWAVLVHAPRESVFGFVDEIQTLGLIATLLEVLLIGGLGAVLAWRTASSIDRLTAKTETMRKGDLDVDLSTDRIDTVGRLYAGFASMRDSLDEQIETAESAREEAEQARAEAEEMNEYLESKAERFSEVMERAAAGDLTTRMDTDDEHAAMDRIAESFNDMIDELEKTTGQLQTFADIVEESGGTVHEDAIDVRETADDITATVGTVAEDAGSQRERLETVATDLEGVVDRLERIDGDHDDVDLAPAIAEFDALATAIQASLEDSSEIQRRATSAREELDAETETLDSVAERADRLERYAQPLGDILEQFETDAEHEFVFTGGATDDDETGDAT